MKLRRMLALLVAALLLAAAMPARAEYIYYGSMMVDNCEEWVSLRDGPGSGCGRLAKVPLYAIVTDAEWEPICGDYIYCRYDGQFGYILARYLTPWADPEPEDGPGEGGPVRVDWAEATDDLLVVDPDGEYVTIMADEAVSNLALLSLLLNDYGEDGIAFSARMVCLRKALVPEEPLVVKIAFPGDIPSYGLRFTDASGQMRQYAISVSGRDGSLVLEPF